MELLLKGRKTVGVLKGISISIDWDYILREGGKRREVVKIQHYIGRFLSILSVISFITILLLQVSIGNIYYFVSKPETFLDLAEFISIGVLLYSFYLTRDLERFIDKLGHAPLEELKKDIKDKKLTEIELTDYFDHDLLDIFDRLIKDKPVNYIKRLIVDLMDYKMVQGVIVRLGLNPPKVFALDYSNLDQDLSKFEQFITDLLLKSFNTAFENNFKYVDERAVFLSLMRNELEELFLGIDVKQEEIDGVLLWVRNYEKEKYYYELWKTKAALKPTSIVNRSFTSGFAGTLNQFSRDFTLDVVRGNFVLSIAREEELESLVDMMSEGEKNAVLLVGEPGVGKTTLLRSLALRMVVEDVPKVIQDMRLVAFDIAKASSISKNIDSFKSKLQKVFEDTAKAKNIILVFEDITQLLAGRGDLANEMVGIIIDAIDRYKIRIIITATNDSYTKYIKPKTGLISLLNVLSMEEPSDETTQQILLDLTPRLEKMYKINISFDAISKTVELSHKVLHDKVLPQKAVDILEEAAAKAGKLRDELLTEGDIEDLISKKVGVKIGKITGNEAHLLNSLEETLHKRVIGQDMAVSAVASALRRSRAGLSGTSRPIASFLFFGPTGVGKTETAKTIAEVYYGSEGRMVRLDMSEYQEKENLDRLTGYLSGEKFEGGFLTEPIREYPFSLILLDELEKATPKVLDLFLQILDEGQITDGLGRKVDFTSTIIIATSNANSKVIADELELGKDYEQVLKILMPKLRETFKVEFLNRFDKIVMYKSLNKGEIISIADLMMKKEVEKLKEKGIELTYATKLIEQLAELGYDPIYGARELRRVIQDKVEDPLARLLINGNLKTGSKYRIENLEQF